MLNKNTNYLTYFLVLTSMVLGGCTLTDVNGTKGRSSSQEDLEAARQILGESLSSDNSGIVLSLNDALTTISNNAFLPQKKFSESIMTQSDRSGRGNEINYTHSYISQNGIHAVSFQRQVEDPLFSKSVSDTLRYNFRNNAGEHIQFPHQNDGKIETIYFDGRREGQISRLKQQSTFVRQDTFIISNVNTSGLSINGVHHGSGSMVITPSQQASFERFYQLEINLLNINAPRSVFNSNQSIWRDISGTLSWQLRVKNSPTSSSSKDMGGTIKLTGAGIALLKLQGSPDQFQVNLDNGDVKNRDTEFEGALKSIDLDNRRITLLNDRTLYLNDSSEIDDDDYPTLQAVHEALMNGATIWAEGEGFLDGDRFIISEVEFEREENEEDEEREEIEFSESVSAVNTDQHTFTLANTVTVLVQDSTRIDDDSDFPTLQAVADALESGQSITADGEGYPTQGGGTADLAASSVTFERNENDNNGEED